MKTLSLAEPQSTQRKTGNISEQYHETARSCSHFMPLSGSVPSNIAEGSSRNTRKEFTNFLYMAHGSLNEIDTQLEIAKGLQYLATKEFTDIQEKMDRVGKMITGLIKKQKAVE